MNILVTLIRHIRSGNVARQNAGFAARILRGHPSEALREAIHGLGGPAQLECKAQVFFSQQYKLPFSSRKGEWGSLGSEKLFSKE